MNKDKKWMLMTYYCPTHGDTAILEPIEITREEISKTFLKKVKPCKKLYEKISSYQVLKHKVKNHN